MTQTLVPLLLTDAPAGSPEWLKARAGRITASTAASILCPGSPGVYGTPLSEYQRIRAEMEGRAIDEAEPPSDDAAGDPDDDEHDESPAAKERAEFAWGRDNEPGHRSRLEAAIAPTKILPAPGVYQHGSIPWLAATPDGLLDNGDGERGVLELKAPTFFKGHRWSLGAPIGYIVQTAVQMAVMDCKWGILSAWLPPRPRWQRVYADPVMWDWIQEGLYAFWHDHVLAEIPPKATGTSHDLAALKAMYPQSSGQTKVLPASVTDPFLGWRDAKERELAAKKEKEAFLVPLLEAMGDAEAGILPGDLGTFTLKETVQNRPAKAAYTVKFRTPRWSK